MRKKGIKLDIYMYEWGEILIIWGIHFYYIPSILVHKHKTESHLCFFFILLSFAAAFSFIRSFESSTGSRENMKINFANMF